MEDTQIVTENPSPIITDPSLLRQQSVAVHDLESASRNINLLLQHLPETALGLAAPQIGIFEKIFVVNLSSGRYVFINPEITWASPDQIPSIEGCLSLPGIARCVSRHFQINVSATNILHVVNDAIESLQIKTMRLKNLDSCIVQHEYDHLMGVLIIDLPEQKTRQEIAISKSDLRRHQIFERRQNKFSSTQNVTTSRPSKSSDRNKRSSVKSKKEAAKERRKLVKRLDAMEKLEHYNQSKLLTNIKQNESPLPANLEPENT